MAIFETFIFDFFLPKLKNKLVKNICNLCHRFDLIGISTCLTLLNDHQNLNFVKYIYVAGKKRPEIVVNWPYAKVVCFFGIQYCGDFTRGFDTQNYPKLQASLGTQPENTHIIQRQTQPNPYPWIFSGNTLGYPRVPALNFYPWVPWVPVLNFYPWVPWTQFKLVYIVY